MRLENSIASSFQNILNLYILKINKEVSNHSWSEYGFVNANFEVFIFDEPYCPLIYLSFFVFVNNFLNFYENNHYQFSVNIKVI